MPVRSAGILLWRRSASGALEVLIGHMGGPFWTRKDGGAWSLPKGEYDDTEPPLQAALREFTEELGVALPVDPADLVELGEVRQPSGKRLVVWAGQGELDPSSVVPGTFQIEWPPRSGKQAEFPELDRVEWSTVEDARERLVVGQRAFLDQLIDRIG
ncbi:MAG TPA: NUDIX domain-containing protein [Mycobacteriales bacterium]|jgi:predicted NUDIX family NTP pyrophosphohydrolase|nr:NUDIX domain-containing protein [Mycobacteriales bacterium]